MHWHYIVVAVLEPHLFLLCTFLSTVTTLDLWPCVELNFQVWGICLSKVEMNIIWFRLLFSIRLAVV